jgi:aminoglycoside phosphotransferase family enzyme
MLVARSRAEAGPGRPPPVALALPIPRAPQWTCDRITRLRFVRDIEEIRRDLEEVSAIPKSQVEAVASHLLDFIQCRGDLLDTRVREGRIVEAHGDLRPEHVCLVVPPVVIDCLEFAPELRRLDPADELSFLAVECELAGGPPFIEEVLFGTYGRITRDRPPPGLVRFYKTFRAFLRAKITIWHLHDPDVKDTSKWVSKTCRYLDAAVHSSCSS